MGLIRAALGAAGGVMADQWKEYFYCESLHARQEQEPVKLRLFPCEADVLPPHAKERNFLPQARVGILVIYADRGGIDSLPNAVH